MVSIEPSEQIQIWSIQKSRLKPLCEAVAGQGGWWCLLPCGWSLGVAVVVPNRRLRSEVTSPTAPDVPATQSPDTLAAADAEAYGYA